MPLMGFFRFFLTSGLWLAFALVGTWANGVWAKSGSLLNYHLESTADKNDPHATSWTFHVTEKKNSIKINLPSFVWQNDQLQSFQCDFDLERYQKTGIFSSPKPSDFFQAKPMVWMFKESNHWKIHSASLASDGRYILTTYHFYFDSTVSRWTITVRVEDHPTQQWQGTMLQSADSSEKTP